LTKKLKTKVQILLQRLVQNSGDETREAKKIVNQLVQDGVLEYWSSGSTSMYGLPGTGKQAGAEHED
jgi:predicted transcriptional regulator